MGADAAEMGDERAPDRRLARAHWLMFGLVASFCALLWNGERIPAAGGLGWDGQRYAAIVREPGSVLTDKYYLNRALPSWIVHGGMRVLQMPIDTAGIVQGFLALNTLLLLIVAALWRPVADRLNLGLTARWLGFAGLFVNFAFLKMPFYNPVLTDVAAFALGMLLIYGSLARKRWVLAGTLVAASFTWPIGALLGTTLLLWPARVLEPPHSDRPGLLGSGAGLAAAALFLAWFVWLYALRGQTMRASSHVVPVVPGVVWLGVVGAVLYIFYLVRRLLAGVTMSYVWRALRTIDPRGLLLAIAAITPARLLIAIFGEGEPALSIRRYIGDVVLLGSSRPLLFMLANVVYFGPVMLLLVSKRFRDAFADRVRELGPGWILFMIGTIGLSLNSESRHIIFSYPLFIVLLAAAADRAGVSRWITAALLLMGLGLSKIWLPINVDAVAMLDDRGPTMTLHYRRYFQNHGPWMPNTAYLEQLVIIAFAAAVLWWVLRTRPLVGRTASRQGT